MPKRRINGSGSLTRRDNGIYIARWFDHEGRRRQRSTRTSDRRAAERLLHQWVAEDALRRGGVVDPRLERISDQFRRPLREHIDAYIRSCLSSGQAPLHVAQKERHLHRFKDSASAERLSDITPEALQSHMTKIRDIGRSARTANFARQIIVAFMSWCVKHGRADRNPLAVVPRLDERRDRRRIRRPLTDDELVRLLDVARPRGRAAWYLAAALAGLRRGDLRRLRWSDINFTDATITITTGKAKRTDVIPMHPQLAAELDALREHALALPQANVFPTVVTDQTRLKDFLRAGIAREEVVRDAEGQPVIIGKRNPHPKTQIVVEDADGRVVDLHALRTTLGTNLARAGVAPQIAQRIMRHGDYRTTLEHYTVLGLTDTSRAVERLPAIGAAPDTEAATGTHGDNATSTPGGHQICHQCEQEQTESGATPRNEPAAPPETTDAPKPLKFQQKSRPTHREAASSSRAGDRTRTGNIQLGRRQEDSVSSLPTETYDTPPGGLTQSPDNGDFDLELQRLATLWPSLPAPVRAGIMAMAESVSAP